MQFDMGYYDMGVGIVRAGESACEPDEPNRLKLNRS